MKIKMLLMLLAILATFLSTSCSSESNSSNSNQMSVLMANSSTTVNAETHQAEEKDLGDNESNTLDDQAQAQATEFFEKRYAKCGEYYYYKYDDRGNWLYQCKYSPTISVEGETFQPKQLSEADRLNGVDPLPVSWNGRAEINLGLCRHQIYSAKTGPGYNAWGEWTDKNSKSTRLSNKKGVWEFHNKDYNGKEYFVPVSCDEVPSADKRTAVKEPYWADKQDLWGRILTIPANYGKWFYVGRGPMSIDIKGAFSRIDIDGSNNTRSPTGAAYYMGAQDTSPDAIAPKLMLGAVIAKLGENGEPFQLFSDKTGQNKNNEIKSNDKVYIAINDSYYGDNRGEHVVYVKGENLCVNCSSPEKR